MTRAGRPGCSTSPGKHAMRGVLAGVLDNGTPGDVSCGGRGGGNA